MNLSYYQLGLHKPVMRRRLALGGNVISGDANMNAFPGLKTNHVPTGMLAAKAGKHALHSIPDRNPTELVIDHVSPSSCPEGNGEELQDVDKEGQERVSH